MATLTVTNLTAAPLFIGDLYTTIPPNGSVSTKRTAAEVEAMTALQNAVSAGLASFVLSPPASGGTPEVVAHGYVDQFVDPIYMKDCTFYVDPSYYWWSITLNSPPAGKKFYFLISPNEVAAIVNKVTNLTDTSWKVEGFSNAGPATATGGKFVVVAADFP